MGHKNLFMWSQVRYPGSRVGGDNVCGDQEDSVSVVTSGQVFVVGLSHDPRSGYTGDNGGSKLINWWRTDTRDICKHYKTTRHSHHQHQTSLLACKWVTPQQFCILHIDTRCDGLWTFLNKYHLKGKCFDSSFVCVEGDKCVTDTQIFPCHDSLHTTPSIIQHQPGLAII